MTANYPSVAYVSKSASDPRVASDINQLQDDVLAHANDYITGWITAGETWVYASATTYTVTGDKTTKYRKGTKIKLTQTTDKYFYVVAVSYSAPNTTVTLAAGSDYSLANATITSPYYSYADCPQGFPDWFNWAPTCCGFGAYDPPTTSASYMFSARGTMCFVSVFQNSSGCSNATHFTVSLPISACGAGTWGHTGFGVNNGSSIKDAIVFAAAGSAALYASASDINWVASGSKRAGFEMFYRF